MKRSRTVLILAVALVLVAAVLVGVWYKTPISLVSQDIDTDFTISRICTGTEEADISTQTNLAEVANLIAGYSGVREFPNQRASVDLTDDVIQIDGTDAEGPVHVVLTASEGYLYRSGIENCVDISQSDELYEAVCGLIS
jgi:hypothetical protein